MLRRIVGWIVLVPLSVVLIVFSLANRQLTVVNFNPFIAPDTLTGPGAGVPLFLVIFVFLLLGVVMGGIATWVASTELRRDRRRWRRETERLGRELDRLRRTGSPPTRALTPLDIDDLVDMP